MSILITGANGFVGSAVCDLLRKQGVPLKAGMRQPGSGLADAVCVPDLGPEADWAEALRGVEAVVHCAARVHVMRDAAADPLAEFRAVNTQGTLKLARQAAAAGVKRFVFVSSIKVNGERTEPGRPFVPEVDCPPQDPYGLSKYEAEQGLWRISRDHGMEVVVVRPPLIYGPGVRANFLAMMRWISFGIPLPLGALDNRRSLVALGNLADLLVRCVTHPGAPGNTFLVSDGEDVSTTELLRRIGAAMGRPARLIPVPAMLLQLGAGMLGRADMARRLCDSLQVDSSATRERLAWQPPLAMDAALRMTASAFLAGRSGAQ